MHLPDKEDIQLLTQTGFLAAGRGDVPRALRIFEALVVLRPDHAFGFIGIASALMNAGRATEAVQRLQSVRLPPGAETDMLEAFLGLALQLAGRVSESHYLLRRTVRHARPDGLTEGARLAARLLGETPCEMTPCVS